MAIFWFFTMAAVRHLGFVVHTFGPPWRESDGLYHCAKFGWNRYSSFDNMQVLIFCKLGLKMPIHAPKLFQGQNKGRGGAMLTQRARSYFWELLPLCQFWRKSIKKNDREEGVSPISPAWRLKLVATVTSLERSRNEYQIEHLQPYVYQRWKFGEDRSGRFWDLFAPSDR